jgi:uncharacterized protein YlzI (FlbEa/FlbD family)
VLRLTDINDDQVAIAPDTVMQVLEQPRGQTMIVFASGTTLQVKESVEQVTHMLEKEKAK